MYLLVLLVLALAPGVFWLWLFLRRDVFRPNPRRLLVVTFLLGMVATVPAGLLEFLLIREALEPHSSFLSLAGTMVFVVGPVEELTKFAAVRLVPYRSLYFDEPLDGLTYSAAASLGFASLENLGYMIAYGPAVILVRGPFSTLAHLVFGSIWGYALGVQAHRRDRRLWPIAAGLAVAAFVHGAFNVTAVTVPPVAVGLVVIGGAWVITRLDWGQRVSPFRFKQNYPLISCGVCGGQIRVTSRYCRFCATPVQPTSAAALFCGFCGARNPPQASFCTQCGDRFIH